MKIKKIVIMFIVLLWLSIFNLHACTLPVFRYALMRWYPAQYEVFIFHRGLATKDEILVTQFQKTAESNFANIEIKTINLNEPLDEETQKLWEQQSSLQLPWLVVYFPKVISSQSMVWSGVLTEEAIKKIVYSPKRKEIADWIIKGNTAIWILLESGDKKKDNKTAKFLKKELKHQEVLCTPPKKATFVMPFLAKFPLIRLSLKDSAEEILLNMLLKSNPKLKQFSNEPMVFMVFGRGRMIGTLMAEGINKNNIAQGCVLSSSACSCEIKSMRPGIDLLMAVDWTKAIKEVKKQ